MSWISPRIWRSAESRFNDDEPLQALDVYTPDVLQQISHQGFDAIWMRGRLRELMRSDIFPELNDSGAAQRVANLKQVIADGDACGVKLYLYFNEPLSLPPSHDFWKRHPELAGEPYVEHDFDWDELALCTSAPGVKEFFDESLRHLFSDLLGLGGVILITASEYHTHCWSHRSRRIMNDKYMDNCLVDVACSRCRDREPAEVVTELIEAWQRHAAAVNPAPRVWAWNWSWTMWYDSPPRDIIDKLPDQVELMCDFERGGSREQTIGTVAIDEYALGYVGPSEQFQASRSAALETNRPVCAKLQIGTTHEIATVPNLPLIPNLFDKLKQIEAMQLDGLMCSWNFANSASLNTAAFGLFVRRADLRQDQEAFCHALAVDTFQVGDSGPVLAAWKLFCDSFAEYPFAIKMLYHSPMNFAPAYPLTLDYRDHPLGPMWVEHHPWGDRLDDCLEPFTLDQVCLSFEKMETLWNQGLALYAAALEDLENRNAREELSCARMIGCHLSAMRIIFEFHRHRKVIMEESGLSGPCTLPADLRLTDLIQQQKRVASAALELIRLDTRFGYHQEAHAFFYDEKAIESAIRQCSME